MAETVDLDKLLSGLKLFADVKKSDMKKLQDPKHLSFRHAQAGEVIVRQSELDTEFFIVLEGVVTAYRTEADGTTGILGSFEPGDWFGEMSAISHQPRSATVKADTAAVLLMLDVTVFQLMFSNQKSSFRELIDTRYRDRALSIHLVSAPIFKATPKEILAKVAKKAELASFAKDSVVAKEGGDADAVYLVRSGIIKRSTVLTSGDELVQEYLCDNSSFGEHSLTDDHLWPSTYTALSHVDVVRIPRDLFREVYADATARTRLQEQVKMLVAEDTGITTDLSHDENIEHLVGKETLKGTEALVIDLKKCTRCNACVESCVAVHDDRVPRLSKRGIKTGDLMLSSACYNCKIPECMMSCKFGAIRRDVEGQIHIVLDNCTGCSLCESHCPYGVIRMADLLTPEQVAAKEKSLWEQIPILNKIFHKKPVEVETAGKTPSRAIKCDLCAGLPFEACVYNCPCGAISRRNPESLRAIGTVTLNR